MNIEMLSDLEQAIAAGRGDAQAFGTAARILQDQTNIRRFRALCDLHAYADAAILAHRALLPEHGFQFGEAPPGGTRLKGMASHWRRGDGHAMPFVAATPGLALLHAALHGASRAITQKALTTCTRCGGLGWTQSRAGKEVCPHDGAR